MDLNYIIERPTGNGKIHENNFRCYHILEQVLLMIKRNDSKDTILEVVNLLRNVKEPEKK